MSRPRVVVVTGASAGVGRAVAVGFAREGAHVGVIARGRAGLAGAQRDVEAAGGRALAIPTDVADADQVEAAAAQVERTFGPIDVWVNNAMASVFSPVTEITPAEFKRVTGGFQDEVRRAFDGDEPGSGVATTSTTSSAPGDDSGEHMVGRPAAASSTPDVDLPPPPDDPSFN